MEQGRSRWSKDPANRGRNEACQATWCDATAVPVGVDTSGTTARSTAAFPRLVPSQPAVGVAEPVELRPDPKADAVVLKAVPVAPLPEYAAPKPGALPTAEGRGVLGGGAAARARVDEMADGAGRAGGSQARPTLRHAAFRRGDNRMPLGTGGLSQATGPASGPHTVSGSHRAAAVARQKGMPRTMACSRIWVTRSPAWVESEGTTCRGQSWAARCSAMARQACG